MVMVSELQDKVQAGRKCRRNINLKGIFISAFLLVVHFVYLATVSKSCSLFVTVTVFCVHHSTPIQSIVTIALFKL